MAHTILVRLDVDDEYADIHPDITATDYLEGSKAHGWEVVTERMFTESEVKAILVNITHECGCYEHRGEPVFATRVDDINHIAAMNGIVLDPA